jgi:tight adherence protein B
VPAPVAAAGVLVGVMAVVTAGPGAVLTVALVAAVAIGAHRWRARAAARAHRATQLPHALDALAASLRSGASLPAALGEAGDALDAPLGPELAGLARAAARGRPVAEVLDEWSIRHGDPATRLAATAMLLATMVGSAPARAVDGVASTVRERLDLAAERRALGAQARASALVLSAAPVVFTVVLVAGDPSAGHFLLGTPGGWACLAVGLSLDAAGAWWMARLTRGPHP